MPDLIGNVYLNYQDMMRKTNNLDTPFGVIGRELDSVNEFITDLPLVQASNMEYDEGSFIEPWRKDAHSDLADFQSPYFSHDFDTYGRKDTVFLRKSAIAMKRNDYRKNPSEMENYRMKQTQLTIADIMRDMSDDFVHGNPKKDFRHAIGLEARFDMLTDMDGKILAGEHKGEINPYITLDAGGRNQSEETPKLTSVYMLIPSDMGVCRIYPTGGDFTGGISYLPGDWTRIQETDRVTGKTGWNDERVDFLDICQGLCFRNRRAGLRIANIDMNTDDGMKKFIDTYYEACEVMQECTVKGQIILYANSRMRVQLKKYFNRLKNPITAVAAKPEAANQMDYYIDESVKIRPNNHITCAEATMV